MEFWHKLYYLLKIAIPSWKCEAVFDISCLTLFLIIRSSLSIYLSSIKSEVVKGIIE